MKICGKKLIAGAAALAMSCTMASAFATEGGTTTVTGNKVVITSVQVLNDGNETGTEYVSNGNVSDTVRLTTAQMLKVSAKIITGSGGAANGEISFLSNLKDSSTLDNSTIQYVDQKTSDGSDVTVTFRPRTTIGTGETKDGKGTFVAKLGGTDVSQAASFNYVVGDSLKTMSFGIDTTSSSASITKGGSCSFKLTDTAGNSIVDATVKAVCGSDIVNAEYNTSTGLYTIKFEKAGTYTVSAEKEGYVTPTALTVTVNEPTVPEDKTEEVTGSMQEELDKVTQGGTEATLPDKVGEYSVSYEFKAPTGKIDVNAELNKVSLKDGVFAAKVTVDASIGNTVKTQKVIYLVSDPNTNISFGNLGLVSTSDGKDAFASDEALSGANVEETVKTEAKAEALNYALDRATPDNAIKSAIDYDMNGDITLSEYRMLKKLFEGDVNFSASKLTSSRSQWLNKQNTNE